MLLLASSVVCCYYFLLLVHALVMGEFPFYFVFKYYAALFFGQPVDNSFGVIIIVDSSHLTFCSHIHRKNICFLFDSNMSTLCLCIAALPLFLRGIFCRPKRCWIRLLNCAFLKTPQYGCCECLFQNPLYQNCSNWFI